MTWSTQEDVHGICADIMPFHKLLEQHQSLGSVEARKTAPRILRDDCIFICDQTWDVLLSLPTVLAATLRFLDLFFLTPGLDSLKGCCGVDLSAPIAHL